MFRVFFLLAGLLIFNAGTLQPTTHKHASQAIDTGATAFDLLVRECLPDGKQKDDEADFGLDNSPDIDLLTAYTHSLPSKISSIVRTSYVWQTQIFLPDFGNGIRAPPGYLSLS